MLTVQNLTLTHTKDLTDLIADLSFILHDGERMALIGEEGNGKSTLLRALAGDETVLKYISVSGRIVSPSAVGYLPQELPENDRSKSAYEFFYESPVFFDLTPKELGLLAAQLSLSPEVFYSDQLLSAFSGGERIKLQIARLLMSRPAVLLLDEPSNDLDGDAMRWLEDFLLSCKCSVLFVSHDEILLRKTATSILLIERLHRRQVPRASLYRTDYETFLRERASAFSKQEQNARKEREEYENKLKRFEQIRSSVERDQNAVSRQDPSGGRLLKKKMHAVMSMGRRFEREAEQMTAMPEQEEAIFAKLDCPPLPAAKVVLNLDLPELCMDGRVLCKDIHLTVRGNEKICIAGRNGIGKTTLLRLIRRMLANRSDIRIFYMPQDAGDVLDLTKSPIDALTRTGDGDERAQIGIMLGSMKFTADEMTHPCGGLSGGQKAKLLFLAAQRSCANVLLLDEPTRNLSPLSGPVVRRLLRDYSGCIISVSHDRLFADTVCSRILDLTPSGFIEHVSPAELDKI